MALYLHVDSVQWPCLGEFILVPYQYTVGTLVSIAGGINLDIPSTYLVLK